MKLGVHFMPQDFTEYIDSVTSAEAAGFEFAWVIDSQVLWQDPTLYLSRGLVETVRIVFGVAVTNPVTRHVTGTACAFATLDELHPGRVILGIGRGDSSVRAMGMRPASTGALADTVPLLRELMAGRTVHINDTEVRFRWRRTAATVPVMMGATGPRNLRLAGALADRAMLQVGCNLESVTWGMEQVRAGARDAGRDPDEVKISVLCACRISEDQQAAWDACRWAPASAVNHIADVARNNAEHGMPEPMTRVLKARDDFMRSRGEYDYAKHLDDDEQLSYLTAEHIDDFAIAGPPAKCLDQLRSLSALGVDELSIAYWNGEFEQMNRVRTEIVPGLDSAFPVR